MFHKPKEILEQKQLANLALEKKISDEINNLARLKKASNLGLDKNFDTLFLEEYSYAFSEFKQEYCNEDGVLLKQTHESFEYKSKYAPLQSGSDPIRFLKSKHSSFEYQNLLLVEYFAHNLFFKSAKLLGKIDTNIWVLDTPQEYLSITDKTCNGKNIVVHFNEQNAFVRFSYENELKILSEINFFIKNKKIIVKNEHKMPDFLKNCFLLG